MLLFCLHQTTLQYLTVPWAIQYIGSLNHQRKIKMVLLPQLILLAYMKTLLQLFTFSLVACTDLRSLFSFIPFILALYVEYPAKVFGLAISAISIEWFMQERCSPQFSRILEKCFRFFLSSESSCSSF